MTMITLERFRDLVAAYGADPARWPERERVVALELLQRSPEARASLEEARDLDYLLELAPTTAVTPELQTRILAAFPGKQPARSRFAGIFAALLPDRPAWVPAAALALSLALGVGVGAYAPALAGLDTSAHDAASIAMSGGFDDDAFSDDQPGEGT